MTGRVTQRIKAYGKHYFNPKAFITLLGNKWDMGSIPHQGIKISFSLCSEKKFLIKIKARTLFLSYI